jgi:hypothetical protein
MRIGNTILRFLGVVWFISCNNLKISDTLIKDNNVYVTKTDGKIEQVTFIGKDSKALISPDKKVVYFIRQTGNMGEYEYEGMEQLAIMQVDLNSSKEQKLTDTIHYEDWKSTSEIFEVTGFTLSQDGGFIFFITQKWATSGVLVRLNTETKKLTEISHGDKFELIKEGQHRNHIIVTRSSIKKNVGRQWSNWLIDNEGNEIMEIGDDDAVNNFKRQRG